MKKIGLVGGTGPESTLMYYKELNTRIDKLTNGKEMPDIAIESVNFHRAWGYVVREQYDLLTDYLAEKVKNLVDGGAEVVSLTAGTMHIVYDGLAERVSAPPCKYPRGCMRGSCFKWNKESWTSWHDIYNGTGVYEKGFARSGDSGVCS